MTTRYLLFIDLCCFLCTLFRQIVCDYYSVIKTFVPLINLMQVLSLKKKAGKRSVVQTLKELIWLVSNSVVRKSLTTI